MQVTVFTGNGPRHSTLLERVAEVADKVCAVRECGSFGSLFGASDIKDEYFRRVLAAEREVFGQVRPVDVETLPLAAGDLSNRTPGELRRVLASDMFIVFGSSWIRGWLCDVLVEAGALNLHAGVSPEYRGAGTNFWAEYDGHPELVGCTIHLLTAGLDDGDIVEVIRGSHSSDPFARGMLAVGDGIQAIVQQLTQQVRITVEQDRSRQIRYAKKADFTDEVVREYLERVDSHAMVGGVA